MTERDEGDQRTHNGLRKESFLTNAQQKTSYKKRPKKIASKPKKVTKPSVTPEATSTDCSGFLRGDANWKQLWEYDCSGDASAPTDSRSDLSCCRANGYRNSRHVSNSSPIAMFRKDGWLISTNFGHFLQEPPREKPKPFAKRLPPRKRKRNREIKSEPGWHHTSRRVVRRRESSDTSVLQIHEPTVILNFQFGNKSIIEVSH